MRVLTSMLVLFAMVGCSSGAEHGNVFGNSIGSGHAGDDGAATKGNPTMPGGDDASEDEWGEIEESSSSSGDALEDSSSTTEDPPAPAESSSDEGDGESSGAPPSDASDDDAGDVGDPMYSPCDPNSSDCADGFCLLIEDQNMNVLGSFCTGPCALPNQDCDLPSSGTATPACLVSNEGPSICTLDCGGGQLCPDGMQCVEFPGVQLRCV